MAKKKIQDSMSDFVDEKKNWLANKCEKCGCNCSGRWATTGWALLLLGGLAHMLPAQMDPLMKWSVMGITLQMAIGTLSVLLALYYLLGNED